MRFFQILLTIFLLNLHFLIAQPTNIAVMDLAGNIEKSILDGLSNRLRTELFNTNKYDIFERNELYKILEEQNFQYTGCTETSCAVQIGNIIGVNKIVVGRIDKIGTVYSSDIRLVDVKSSKIEKTATVDCEDCQLRDVLLVSIKNVANILAGIEKENDYQSEIIDQSSTEKIKKATRSFKISRHSFGIGYFNFGGTMHSISASYRYRLNQQNIIKTFMAIGISDLSLKFPEYKSYWTTGIYDRISSAEVLKPVFLTHIGYEKLFSKSSFSPFISISGGMLFTKWNPPYAHGEKSILISTLFQVGFLLENSIISLQPYIGYFITSSTDILLGNTLIIATGAKFNSMSFGIDININF
jgi:hypothetical protein